MKLLHIADIHLDRVFRRAEIAARRRPPPGGAARRPQAGAGAGPGAWCRGGLHRRRRLRARLRAARTPSRSSATCSASARCARAGQPGKPRPLPAGLGVAAHRLARQRTRLRPRRVEPFALDDSKSRSGARRSPPATATPRRWHASGAPGRRRHPRPPDPRGADGRAVGRRGRLPPGDARPSSRAPGAAYVMLGHFHDGRGDGFLRYPGSPEPLDWGERIGAHGAGIVTVHGGSRDGRGCRDRHPPLRRAHGFRGRRRRLGPGRGDRLGGRRRGGRQLAAGRAHGRDRAGLRDHPRPA